MNPEQENQLPPAPRDGVSPDLLEWARQTFDEAEFFAEVREIEESGGFRLQDFIAEVEVAK